MDTRAALAAYTRQIRRGPRPDQPGDQVEADEHVTRVIAARDGWAGVTYSAATPETADALIAAQQARFARHPRPWEWKHYSHDEPADLPARLTAAGFTPGPAETLLAAETAAVPAAPPPPGVTLRQVASPEDVRALVATHDRVFGGDHQHLAGPLLAALRASHARPHVIGVLALADGAPIAAARVELPPGRDFAGLWGGGVLPAWRHRGLYRALVAYRAALAATRGHRYLHVDATPASEPILRRLGFHALAVTTPYRHPAGA